MADLLALLQSKAEEIDNESKKKEMELQEKEAREAEMAKALAEMRTGLIEKKRAFDSKKKLLEDKKREREERMKARAALEATGIKIDITVSNEEGIECRVDGLSDGECSPLPSPRYVEDIEINDAPHEEDTALPGDNEQSAREERMKKRRSTIKANDVEYEKGEGGVVTVGAATLPALFDLLVAANPPVQGLDLDHFAAVFVLTHTNFTQSTYLFDVLSKVYVPLALEKLNNYSWNSFLNEYKPLERPVPCALTRARVLEVILKWLERCPKEFHAESILRLLVDTWLSKVKGIVTNISEGEDKEKEEKVFALYEKLCKALVTLDENQKAMQEAKEKEEEERKRKEEARRSEEKLLNIDSSKEDKTNVLLKYSTLMLAQQMTLVDFKLFSSIEYNEFFHSGWTRDNKMDLSPNLVKFIDRFNQLSSWIQTQIVTCETLEGRVELLTRLIQIGKEFEAMNNFQGMMLINAALNSSPILRLKNTWAALPETEQQTFNSLMTTLSHHKNYMVYRSKLTTCAPPLVPFIAIHLSDLTFIDENEDKIHKKDPKQETERTEEVLALLPESKEKKGEEEDDSDLLINFNKMELLSKVLNQLSSLQVVGYDRYQSSLYLQKYFGGIDAAPSETFQTLPEKEIYEWSLKVEPRSAHAAQQVSRKRGFSLGRGHKAKPPLARSNSQKGLTEKEDKDESKKKKKKEKVKNNKYNTINPKKSKRSNGSLADLSVHTNPLLDAQTRKLRRYSEADLSGSQGATSPRELKTLNPLMSMSLSTLPSLHTLNSSDTKKEGTPERPRKSSN